MKIGFWGNVNNYPFSLAWEYKKMGVDVLFIFDAGENNKLCRPEFLYDEITSPYPEWISNKPINFFKLLQFSFPSFFMRKTIQLLNSCDAVILNEYGHSLQPYLKKNLPTISIFSGSDLDVLADVNTLPQRAILSNRVLNLLFYRLKFALLNRQFKNHILGIKNAVIVSYFPQQINPTGNNLIKAIKNDSPFLKFSRHHILLNTIPYSPPPNNRKLVLFSVARFIWKTPLPTGYSNFENKRNDIMIKGVAAFYKKTQIEVELHLVLKGVHIAETKELIDLEGISHLVKWHPEMSQHEVLDFYSKSDIVFDQLGDHIVGGGYQAMAVGRPLIANGRPDVFDNLLKQKSPICQSTTPEDVCMWLEFLSSNASERIEIGKQSREYVMKYFDIKEEALFYLKYLTAKLNVS